MYRYIKPERKIIMNFAEQKKRRDELMRLYFQDIKEKITADGEIIDFYENGNGAEVPLRERHWVAYACLFDEDKNNHRIANLIMENSKYHECHFTPFIAIQIILKHKEKLTEKVYNNLYNYICESLDVMIDNPEYEFVGVNDNFPCMATYTAIIGGELTGHNEVSEWGIRNLKSLCKMLKRRGLPSENISPTYTPVQILPLAELANYTKDEEVKKLAIYAERRIEWGALAFYHSGFGKMCGPYSRAYTVDSTASMHMIDFWLYVVLGKQKLSVLDEMFNPEKLCGVKHHSRWFENVQFVWLAQCDYHITDKMINEALTREFPYEAKGSCEYSSSRYDLPDGKTDSIYPAGANEIDCYMTDEYAVGVSKVPFHSGIQTESFYLLAKKCENPRHSKDLQPIYLRYIVNDEIPQIGEQYLWDKGRKIGLMNKNIGFIGYRPVKRIVGSKIGSLKLSIIIPQIYSKDVQIEKVNKDIYIRIHNTFIAFYALNDNKDVRIEEIENFTMISLYNQCVKPRELKIEDYYKYANGVVFAVADASECSFEEFMKREKKLEVKKWKTSHSRQSFMRNVYFEYENKSLEIEYDVECCGVKYALIDGELAKNKYYWDSLHGDCDENALKEIIE